MGETAPFKDYKTPYLTVDVILVREGKVLLIERHNPPHGWALPGGFVDYGESVETAAAREAKEEVGVDVTLTRQFHVYSDPGRDPRQHTVSVVFLAEIPAEVEPVAGDDAKNCGFFGPDELPPLAFDHAQVLEDFFQERH